MLFKVSGKLNKLWIKAKCSHVRRCLSIICPEIIIGFWLLTVVCLVAWPLNSSKAGGDLMF